MKDVVKPAFIRWLIDLMKADKIIATDEITFLEKACNKFSISTMDIEKSISLSLADAWVIMTEQTRKKERKEILTMLKDLSLSDGACSREEALLILALSYCWNDKTEMKSQLVSYKTSQIDFVDSQVLFVEPNEDEDVNNTIKAHYKSIVNAMRVGGFDFIYIPYIALHYRQSNKELLYKIIKYLAPTLSDNETHNVLDVISNMTTQYFKNEILKTKLGIKIPIRKPSLLIKIGNSYVNGEQMSNFLLVEIEDNIIAQINTLIDTFLDYQRCPTITVKNYTEAGGDFVYAGFYKTIFDLVTYRKGTRCMLVINPDKKKERMKIVSEIETPLNMGLGETAFYVFLIWESLSPRKGVVFVNQGNKKLREIQERFATIYSSFSGSRGKVPDITVGNTRNRMLTVIRNTINGCPQMSEKQGYLPNTLTSKIFVSIEPQLIYVREGKKNIPLLDTRVWSLD